MLMGNQIGQLFGPELEHGEQHYQDWAAEAYTCARRDLIPPDDHPHYGNPYLRQAIWDGKLFFGGSETASYAGGYMRRARFGAAPRARNRPIRSSGQRANRGENNRLERRQRRPVWPMGAGRQAELLEAYRKQLNRLLAGADKEIVTQRAMVATMEQVFSEALLRLEDLSFDMGDVVVERAVRLDARDPQDIRRLHPVSHRFSHRVQSHILRAVELSG